MNSNQSFKSTNNFMRSTNIGYGQQFLVDDAKSLQELGENEIKLRFLEKSLKSKRRIEQRNAQISSDKNIDTVVNKNGIVGRKFPFKAEDFKYPNEDQAKHNTLYIKYSQEYGSEKPNDLDLPEKYFPINDSFSTSYNFNMYKNNSLNTAPSVSKVHKNLDSVV